MTQATATLMACASFILFAGFEARSASMTATLDRDSVVVGESATLTLTFEGGDPEATPSINAGANLRIANRGTSRNVSIANGQVNSTVTLTFSVTPLQAGVYQIPALQARVAGQTVTSQPLKLTSLKAGENTTQPGEQQLAFMRLVVPQKEAFVGQPVSIELQVFVRDGVLNAEEILRAFDSYNAAPINAEGCRVLRTAHANRRRAQNGSAAYSVSTIVTAVVPARTGKITVESIKVPLTLQLPVPGQRRRDFFDPFGMFQQTQQREIVLLAEPGAIESLPLPSAGAPPGFNGAVGSFTMTVEAGPTNIGVGDPITVRTRLEGRGNLEGLAIPEQKDWNDFKTYPPTSKIDTTDPLGLQGIITFEQVVVPQSDKVTALPKFVFTFFDPEKRSYQTLASQPIPLTVRPGGSTPSPTIALPRTGSAEENAPPPQDIVPIKRKLGGTANLGAILLGNPGFLALQFLPVATFVCAWLWRRRTDLLASNPRFRREREVARKVQAGLNDLRKHAAANKSEDFFLTVFRLLQEQIGERLNVPASSITEAVIEERLRPAGIGDLVQSGARELFQLCDQARYAPVRSSQQLEAIIPRVEKVLMDLRGIKA